MKRWIKRFLGRSRRAEREARQAAEAAAARAAFRREVQRQVEELEQRIKAGTACAACRGSGRSHIMVPPPHVGLMVGPGAHRWRERPFVREEVPCNTCGGTGVPRTQG